MSDKKKPKKKTIIEGEEPSISKMRAYISAMRKARIAAREEEARLGILDEPNYEIVRDILPPLRTMQKEATRFCLQMGMMCGAFEIAKSCGRLILDYLKNGDVSMKKEYVECAAELGCTPGAYRNRMSYYIKKDYVKIRKASKVIYHVDMDDFFNGNKNFIISMSKVFTLYREEQIRLYGNDLPEE